jgi:hypothetical protein
MATLDTLQDAVDVLTASTTSLLTEVNVNKSTLTNSATSASNSATNAAASASTATTQATNASNSASAASSSAADAASSASAAQALVLGEEAIRHSVRPSLLLDFANTKTLDPRITFTRASTGTFYDGKTVAKAEENLFLRSQEFDNASWFKLSMSSTANSTVAPDGSTTADTITTTAGIGTDYFGQTLTIPSGLTYVASVYAKYSNAQWLRFRAVAAVAGNSSTWFDIQNGTLGTVESGLTASITSVGNGWYRCTIAFTAISASPDFRLQASTTDGAASQSIGLSVILWGAQLEQRSSVTAYTATTTAPITNYIPALQTAASGVARFEHNPVTGESLGLEIEEQRTNLVLRSDDFANASWTKTNSSIDSNTIVAPDGTLTGDKIVENTSSAVHLADQAVSVTSGTTYTVSAFIKKAERGFAFMALINGFPTTAIQINLTTGAVTTGTGTPLNAFSQDVGNGWFRVGFSLAANSTTTANANFYASNDGVWANRIYLGDGYSGIYIWGAQLEAGAFATSYIPTVASQVTRSADSATMTGTNFSSWYRADEGTLYGEFNGIPELTSSQQSFKVWDGTNNNRTQISLVGASAFFVRMVNGGALQANLGDTPTANTAYKISGAYKVNDTSVSISGAAALTDTTCIIPVVNQAVISSNIGTIKKLAYYPKRLTNAELQGVTTV